MDINIEKLKAFIEENEEYSVDCGVQHDIDSFMHDLDLNNMALDWSLFPLDVMALRGWVSSSTEELKNKPKEVFDRFIGCLGEDELPQTALFRKTFHKNTKTLMNDYALLAWSIRVVSQAFNDDSIKTYNADIFTKDLLVEIAQLSAYDDGPVRAKEFLADMGIALVIERSLPGAIFNGAAIPTRKGTPVIGLTLQYDRVDNFWFTLLHELVHVWKHFDDVNELYIDHFSSEQDDDDREEEANAIAGEALIPHSYHTHDAFVSKTSEAVEDLAKILNICPAIVAGRIQFDNKKYYILRQYVDIPVRPFFEGVNWT